MVEIRGAHYVILLHIIHLSSVNFKHCTLSLLNGGGGKSGKRNHAISLSRGRREGRKKKNELINCYCSTVIRNIICKDQKDFKLDKD